MGVGLEVFVGDESGSLSTCTCTCMLPGGWSFLSTTPTRSCPLLLSSPPAASTSSSDSNKNSLFAFFRCPSASTSAFTSPSASPSLALPFSQLLLLLLPFLSVSPSPTTHFARSGGSDERLFLPPPRRCRWDPVDPADADSMVSSKDARERERDDLATYAGGEEDEEEDDSEEEEEEEASTEWECCECELECKRLCERGIKGRTMFAAGIESGKCVTGDVKTECGGSEDEWRGGVGGVDVHVGVGKVVEGIGGGYSPRGY